MSINTYDELQTITVGSNTPNITFNSIPGTYTDLILVANMATTVAGWSGLLRFNGDSGSNYSSTQLVGTGSAAISSRGTNLPTIYLGYYPDAFGQVGNNNFIVHIQNYSNTTTFKTVFARSNNNSTGGATNAVEQAVGLWRNTAAITSISIPAGSGNILAGSTFSLYGVRAWANTEASPKATGGYVYQDSTYWYHAFPFSSTFTPLQSLTADILVVAGGGGGGANMGGGGGAGGLLAHTSQSLTTIPYTCTVGAGGAGSYDGSAVRGSSGGNSQFASLTAAVGGGGGGSLDSPLRNGLSGGSGGGGAGGYTSGTGGSGGGFTSGQGNTGGAGASGSSGQFLAGAGGGGFSASGGNGSNFGASSVGGSGGNGTASYSSWGAATLTGHNVSGTFYYAGGGGGGVSNASSAHGAGGLGGGGNGGSASGYGGTTNPPQQGVVSSGGGGGGGNNGGVGNTVAAPGGSGVIIVRYAK